MASKSDSLQLFKDMRAREEEKKKVYICPRCGQELSFIGLPGMKGRFYTHPQGSSCKARYKNEDEIRKDEKKVSEEKNAPEVENAPKAESKTTSEEERIDKKNAKRETPKDKAPERISEKKKPIKEKSYQAKFFTLEISRAKYNSFNGDSLSCRELLRAVNKALNNVDLHAFDLAGTGVEEREPLIPRLNKKSLSRFKSRFVKEESEEDLEKKILVKNGVLTRIDEEVKTPEVEEKNAATSEQAACEESMLPEIETAETGETEESDSETGESKMESLDAAPEKKEAAEPFPIEDVFPDIPNAADIVDSPEAEPKEEEKEEKIERAEEKVEQIEAAQKSRKAYIIFNQQRVHLPEELLEGGITIGRSNSCDITIAQKTVSSKHAEIFIRDGRFYLRDLSTNGTFFLREGNKLRMPKNAEALLSEREEILISNIPISFLVEVK